MRLLLLILLLKHNDKYLKRIPYGTLFVCTVWIKLIGYYVYVPYLNKNLSFRQFRVYIKRISAGTYTE